MATFNPYKNSAVDLVKRVHSRDLSVRDLCENYLQRSERLSEKLNSYLFFKRDWIESQLVDLEERIKKGEKLKLCGLPIVIKDNIATKGIPTTCGSKILEGFKPVYDATVIEKLRAQGAVFLAKANCDEFAMGSSNENSAYGPVRNPWDLERVPGGSSGGSAAAVAADLAPLSLGSDTGGSIRQPASLCGVYGLKPTYGRVSRYGLIAYGSSLDQIGPFAQSTKDLALLYDAIAGYDTKDSTSLKLDDENVLEQLEKADPQTLLRGKRIGRVKEFFQDGLEKDVRDRLDAAFAQLAKLGAEIVDVSLPNLRYSIASYYVLATAEASSNLARFDGIRYGYRTKNTDDNLKSLYEKTRSEGFGREVKQRIMLGTFSLSSGYYDAYYGMGLKARDLISDDFRKAFSNVDLLVSPTSPTTAFRLGEKSEDPMAMYLSDICTIGVNLAGVPGMSIPAGYDAKGLPVGMQVIAPWNKEIDLFKGAFAYECATQWWQSRTPEFS